MFQVHHQVVRVVALAALVTAAVGDGSVRADDSGVVIDVNAQKKGTYPIAVPTAVDGDATVSREITQVQSFDFSVAGVFKVLDPQGFLADLRAEGLGIDPQKWKDVGALGVVKFKATATDIEFRLYEVSKGTTAVLTRTYKRASGNTRQLVHRWANEVVKYYTGEPGFFGSKIAFTVKGKKASSIYAMDFDGAGAYSVSNNSSTNILPAYSPSGGQIAYTSFMRNNPDL